MRVGWRACSRSTSVVTPLASLATAQRSPEGRRAMSNWALAPSIPIKHGTSTLPVSCGPQATTPRTSKKPALWAVSSTGLLGWASPCAYLSDHLVRQEQERRRDGDPERLGGLQVDDELKLHGLLHGQVGRLGAPENLVDVDGQAPEELRQVRAIRHKAPGLCEGLERRDRGQMVLHREVGDLLRITRSTHEWRRELEERPWPRLHGRRE